MKYIKCLSFSSSQTLPLQRSSLTLHPEHCSTHTAVYFPNTTLWNNLFLHLLTCLLSSCRIRLYENKNPVYLAHYCISTRCWTQLLPTCTETHLPGLQHVYFYFLRYIISNQRWNILLLYRKTIHTAVKNYLSLFKLKNFDGKTI